VIEGRVVRGGAIDDEPVKLADTDEIVGPGEGSAWAWFDVVDPTVVDLADLQQHLGLHPLSVEDARHRGQAPKAEIFGDHVFLVLRPLALSDEGDLQETEIHVFASSRFLLTLRFTPTFGLDSVIQRWRRQPDMLARGTGFAVYALLDAVTDGYVVAAERLEDRADRLEDLVFGAAWGAEGDAELQSELLRLRRGVVRLRRRAAPMRAGIDLLESQSFTTPEMAPYYRDVTDHLLRVNEMVDGIRDLIMTLLDVRSAQAANRLNEAMKKMTAWAGIVLVPTLIAGIYGMNFEGMPELRWQLGYPMAIGLMAGSAIGLYVSFRKRGWL
jgi:magnesium transporter